VCGVGCLRDTDPMTRGDWVLGLLTVVVPALIGAGSALLTQRLSAGTRAPTAASRSAPSCATPSTSSSKPCRPPRRSRTRHPVVAGDRNALLHRMWYRKRALEVVAPRELDAAAEALTVAMRSVMFDELPEGQDI